MTDTNRLHIKQVQMHPGVSAETGNRLGKFVIETENLGILEWLFTPKQARIVGMELLQYAKYA